MKNIIIGEFKHETNSFSPQPANEQAYRERNYLFGDEIIPYFTGVKNEIGAFIDVFADKPEFNLIPAVALNAMPSGPVTADVFYTAKDVILKTIGQTPNVDGILLSLHGAMVTELSQDGEGDLLECIRERVGSKIPIIASLDLHANITKKMVQNSTALFTFEHYPHTDMYECGCNAAQAMYDTLIGKYKPIMRHRKIPILLPIFPTVMPQMKKFVDIIHDWEKWEHVIKINVCHGFFTSDIAELGMSVIAITNNDPELAQKIVDALAEEIWNDRNLLKREYCDFDEVIDEILASDNEQRPFVLADVSDNPGGGGLGDTTFILRKLLQRRVKDVAVAVICDPEAVQAAVKVGVGNRVTLNLGGKGDPPLSGGPLEVTAYVRAITDGNYYNRDEMCHGLLTKLGRTVVLFVNGIEIITTSTRAQPWDLEVFRQCGIVPQDKKVLVVKSAVHYRASYGKIAHKIVDICMPGIAVPVPDKLSYKHCNRPIYPLDEI